MARIDDGERRLYQCARKYDQIVNQVSLLSRFSSVASVTRKLKPTSSSSSSYPFQFDVLVEMMTTRARRPKRRRISSSSKGANNAVPHVSSYEAGNDGKVFVETITKFLQELSDEPAVETDSSSATRDYPE
ncbi:hypothetical protein LINPERPRIM_LOCUS15506 [Linum perenne]